MGETQYHNEPAPGANYFEAVMSSMDEALEEYRNGGEELHINIMTLEASSTYAPELNTYYDEETGEEVEYETGEEVKTHTVFLITTGGPHAEIRYDHELQSYRFHYWTWFHQDEYSCGFFGSDLQTVQEVFSIYFEVSK